MHGRNRSKGRRRIWTTNRFDPGHRLREPGRRRFERELQEVMAAVPRKKSTASRHRTSGPNLRRCGQRRKGRVVAVRGPDVFVDVPGERSQGVLPVGAVSPRDRRPSAPRSNSTVEGYDEEERLAHPVAPRGRGPGRLVHRRRRHGRRSPRNGHE